MKVKVLGFSDRFHWSKNGREGDAVNVFIAREPNSRETVTGLVCDRLFLGDGALNLIPDGGFKVGQSYDFVYSFDGRFNTLEAINPV